RSRMQALRTIDLLVEERVEEVEACNPRRHGQPENPRLPRQLAGNRDPGADRRKPVDGAEPEVTEPRKPLQVRVDDEADHRDRPEPAHDRIELEDRHEEDGQRGEAEPDDVPRTQESTRNLARRGARVARVDAGVDQPVQAHRERPGTDHRHRDPDQVVRARNPVDGEERADVGERQREHRVLDLHERCKTAGVAESARRHVWRWLTSCSPASNSRAWASAGLITANPSRQPPGEPGRLTTSVLPRTPATPRERRACGVFAIESARMASAMPGAARSRTLAVACGVRSRGPSPVPPVVSTTSTSSARSSIARAIASRSSGTTRRTTSRPSPSSSSWRTSPLLSSRVPSDTPSETVSTAAFTPALSSSRAV